MSSPLTRRTSKARRYRIALVSALDPADRRSWSGIPYHMFHALERCCGQVVPLGPVRPAAWTLGRIASKVSRAVAGRSIDYQHTLLLARKYGEYFSEKLRATDCDVVFAPAAASEISFLETDRPIILSADAHFHVLREYYSFYSRLAEWSARSADEIERRALHKSAAVVYPTSWPVASAIAHYGLDPSRIHVVPYGANIDTAPTRQILQNRKQSETCRLLFLGVEWERKGGDIAYETLLSLHRLNIDAELTVVGCTPPPRLHHPRMHIIPYLSKNDRSQQTRFDELLLSSDFLLLPTRAEAFGIVFCEASAYGVPSISTDTGGVSGAIVEGKNGHLLPPGARGADYARLVASIFKDTSRRRRLMTSSRSLYEKTLNWTAWGNSMRTIIERAALEGRSPSY